MTKLLLNVIFSLIAISTTGCKKREVQDTAVVDNNAYTSVIYDTQSQIYTARTWQGIPSVEVTDDGRLFSAWYSGQQGEGPGNYITVSESQNNGQTWVNNKIIIAPKTNLRVFDPCLWYDKEAKALKLFYAQSVNKIWDGKGGVWCTSLKINSKKWTAPLRICDGIMMNKPIWLSEKQILYPVAYWDKVFDSYEFPQNSDLVGVNIYISQGQDVKLQSTLHIPANLKECYEPQVVKLTDGRLWVLIRTAGGIYQSFSKDKGKTWDQVRPFDQLGQTTTSRFHLRMLKSKHLLLVMNASKNREKLTVFLSKDDGKTWPYKMLIDNRTGVSYPDAAEDGKGNIYLIYDRNRYTDKEILFTSFTESEIENGKKLTIKNIG